VAGKDGTVTNTDRMVQLGRKAIDAPGDAKPDLWIIQELARRLGLDWNYEGPRDVFNEMRKAMNSIAGITWERLEAESSVTYPCEKEGDPGQSVVFVDRFPDADRARAARACRHHSGRRAARPRVSIRADHGPPARALAYRRDDAARLGARRDRAGAGRVGASLDLDAIGRSPVTSSRSNRVAASFRSSRAPTTARRAAPCSSRSAITRQRPLC
jgi:hypothetical protein